MGDFICFVGRVGVVGALLACVGEVGAKPQAAGSPGLVAQKPAEGRYVETARGFMVPYTTTIPGTDVKFEMIPVAGGEFFLGSPDAEAARSDDEGPQVRVRVEPYWIGKCEVTWGEYHEYMSMYDAFKKFQQLKSSPPAGASAEAVKLIGAHAWDGTADEEPVVDAVTAPTPLYDASTTYMAGDGDDQPAVTMTPFAARQYTKWLSGVSGCEYRLPSEAEWEYAARAGTTTAYSYGDDASALGDYAWFDENSDYLTHPVGTKKPNAWGLYDMHGNVAEWTLEEYRADRYAELARGAKPQAAADIIVWPTKVFPRVIRGGAWLDAADRCRSAARQKSEDAEWKLSDPNRPLSPWWYTEEPAMGVGMRLVRPLAPMSADDKLRAWEADAEYVKRDVAARLKEGRGVRGKADATLPAAVEAAKQIGDRP